MGTYEFIDGHLFVFFGMHVAIRHLLQPESKIKKNKRGWPYTFEHGTPDLNYSSDAFLNVKFTRTLQAFFTPTNDEFASKLGTAILFARSTGNGTKLRECVEAECFKNALDLAAE